MNEKQSKATPGPWSVVHDTHSSRELIADLVNNAWIAAAPGQQLGDWMADARLMAAAPDLRDALRTAVKLVEADVICARPANRETLIEALRGWNAALAKLDN